jgi:hypothetical protein
VSNRVESPTIRLAVLSLGAVVLLCVASIVFLAATDKTIPDALNTIGSGAAGALATLLTTFTPSPLPGGRRLSDAVVPVPLEETETNPAWRG